MDSNGYNNSETVVAESWLKYLFNANFSYFSCILFFCVLPETVFSQWKLLSSNLDNIGITAICANETVWLAGERYKDVLWFSTDRGKNWKTIDKGDKQFTYGYKTIVNNNGKIVAGVLDGDRGYWGTYENSGQKRIGGGFASQPTKIISFSNEEWLRLEWGLFSRSTDGGLTWQNEFPPLQLFYSNYDAVEKSGILYLVGYQTSVVSTDRGKTFQSYNLPSEKPSSIHLSISNDKIIAFFFNSTGLKIYSSPLGIKPNWTLQSDIFGGLFSYIWEFEVYQEHIFGIANGTAPTNLFYSNASKKTITPISNGIDNSIYVFCLQVLGDTVLLGTSKGLYWTKLSEIDKAIVLSNESINDTGVLIYPNPTESYLMIENLRKIVKIEMVDLMGKVQSIDFQIITENKVQFSSKNLSNGIYFVNLHYPDQSKETKKIIVQH
jgi:Secretion system C-terminal sorting domain